MPGIFMAFRRMLGGRSANPEAAGIEKAAGELLRRAQAAGIEKQAMASMWRSMSRFSDTFLGETNWLTGYLPIESKLPDGTPPRRFQYQPGINITPTPRTTEALTFAQLRSLGEYTIIRVIIEHVKYLLKSKEWDIIPTDRESGQAHTQDVAAAKKFFDKPDRRHDWGAWLGMLLEEVLVVDALSIYPHRTRGGRLWAMEIRDGATIKVLVDERGDEPLPPAPAYQQTLYGQPYANFTKDELLYRPMNHRAHKLYGYSPVEWTAITINMGMRRELYQLSTFTEGTIPAAWMPAPVDWTPEDILEYQKYLDSILAGDPATRSRIRVVPGGSGDIKKFLEEESASPHSKFDEWLARVFCFALGISPMAFIQMTNRSVAQELGDQEAEGGVAVLALFVERVVNEIIRDWLEMPHLSFNWITDRSRLQAKRVTANTEYARVGVKSIDEIRADEGSEPLGLRPGVVTPTGFVPFRKSDFLPTSPFQKILPNDPGPAAPASTAGARVGPPPQEKPALPPAVDHSEHPEHHRTKTPGPQGPSVEKAMAKARLDELGTWERWALSRLSEGKLGTATFETEFVSQPEAALVKAALPNTKTPDEVRRLFSERRKTPVPVALSPEVAGDADHRMAELRQELRQILIRHAERTAGGGP